MRATPALPGRLALVLLAVLACPAVARAQVCTVTTPGLNFGSYDVFAATTPILTTYNNIGTADGDFTDSGGHTRSTTATDPSSYLSRPFGLLMTNTSLCSLPNNQFRLNYGFDNSPYILNASNPGQFDWSRYYREKRILTSIQVSNPAAVRIIAQGERSFLSRLRESARAVAVLGDMLELGAFEEEAHRGLGRGARGRAGAPKAQATPGRPLAMPSRTGRPNPS